MQWSLGNPDPDNPDPDNPDPDNPDPDNPDPGFGLTIAQYFPLKLLYHINNIIIYC